MIWALVAGLMFLVLGLAAAYHHNRVGGFRALHREHAAALDLIDTIQSEARDAAQHGDAFAGVVLNTIANHRRKGITP